MWLCSPGLWMESTSRQGCVVVACERMFVRSGRFDHDLSSFKHPVSFAMVGFAALFVL
jgi:hypothetical protein